MTSTLLILFFSLFCACSTDPLPKPVNEDFEKLNPTLYYPDDPFASHTSLYGKWKFVQSYGGFMGTGYPIDFDCLLLKPNGLFGIQRNDSLITYGYLDQKSGGSGKLIVYLKTHNGDWKNINLLGSDEKTIELTNDSLFLRSPCCDMYDELFVKN